jgi:hypothetical protein
MLAEKTLIDAKAGSPDLDLIKQVKQCEVSATHARGRAFLRGRLGEVSAKDRPAIW